MVEGRMESVHVCVLKGDTEHACCVSDLCVKCLVDAAGLDVLLMCCLHTQGVAVSSEFARGLTDSEKQTRETEKRHGPCPLSESHHPTPLLFSLE